MLCHIVYPGAPGLTDCGLCCVALIPFYKGGMGAQRGDLLEPQSSLAQMRPAPRPLDVSQTHIDDRRGARDTRTLPELHPQRM